MQKTKKQNANNAVLHTLTNGKISIKGNKKWKTKHEKFKCPRVQDNNTYLKRDDIERKDFSSHSICFIITIRMIILATDSDQFSRFKLCSL